MASIGKFNRPVAGTATPATPATPAAPARRPAKYGGIHARGNRDPMPAEGTYRFVVMACKEQQAQKRGGCDTYQVKLKIEHISEGGIGHRVGDTVTVLFVTSGGGAESGFSRLKAFFVNAAGFENEADYDAFDPDGGFIEASAGVRSEYSEPFLAEGQSLVGQLVDCRVARGREIEGKNDYYREYNWYPVVDDAAA